MTHYYLRPEQLEVLRLISESEGKVNPLPSLIRLSGMSASQFLGIFDGLCDLGLLEATTMAHDPLEVWVTPTSAQG
jgi:hypothetical protein